MASRPRRARGLPVQVIVAVMAVVLSSSPACSILFVKPPPPPGARGTIIHCTDWDLAPLADVLLAGLQAVRFMIAYSAKNSDFAGATFNREGTMVLSAGAFAVFAGSSIVGFHSTSECREALAQANEDPAPTRRRRPSPRLNVAPPAPAQPEASDARDGEAPPADAGAPPVAPSDVAPPRTAPAVRQRVDPE
jgi:hypothetical protein